ncbi:MAG TPA: hypothetical protein VJ771_06500 [Candidatus Nitrosotalea sp.]|nr:hypothetical protein [Candidatus Nitrosotalea sp.]
MKEKISVRGGPDFMRFFNLLDKQDVMYKEINEALDLLKKDYSRGDKIPRDLWPKKYIKEHQVHTLFRYKLRSGWRLVYTVSGTKYEKVCTILEAFDHKQYEKRFGY